MRDRTLSSARTFYMKVILPVVWIGGFVAGTTALFIAASSRPEDPELRWMKWLFLVATILGTPFLLWFAASIKRVSMDGTDLLVSNYRREIRVPVGEIKRVYENRRVGPWRVVVETRTATEFGPSFAFIPRLRERLKQRSLWREHPVVRELQALAQDPVPRRPALR